MGHILIATLGSLGDLLPVLGVGKALEANGMSVKIAANPIYREATVQHGFSFVPIGHDHDPTNLPKLDEYSDATAFIDHVNFSQLDRLFDDLFAASEGADAIVAPYFVVPAHLVAEKRGVPFVACALSPAYLIPRSGAGVTTSATLRLKTPRHWQTDLAGLRRRIGLPRRIFPYAATMDDPKAILGLFPTFLLAGAAAEIAKLQVVGYPHVTGDHTPPLDDALTEFCDEHTVVFTFGTHVEQRDANYFYAESVAACGSLGLKCLYLSRFVPEGATKAGSDPGVVTRSFVAHDAVLPLCGLIVHHAGLGTLMAACRHAKPMVCVPFMYDQPYHSARMKALIDSAHVPAAEYARKTISAAIVHTMEHREAMRRNLATLMLRENSAAMRAAHLIIATLAEGKTRLEPTDWIR